MPSQPQVEPPDANDAEFTGDLSSNATTAVDRQLLETRQSVLDAHMPSLQAKLVQR
jgi:hypothetical protein